MKLGTIVTLPNEHSRFGKIADSRGNTYTVEEGDIPEGTEVGDEYAYRVEIWGNDSGIAHDLRDD